MFVDVVICLYGYLGYWVAKRKKRMWGQNVGCWCNVKKTGTTAQSGLEHPGK